MLRRSQLAEARLRTLANSDVVRRANQWARVGAGIASFGDAVIGLARVVGGVPRSLARGGGSVAGAAGRRLQLRARVLIRPAGHPARRSIRGLRAPSIRARLPDLGMMAHWADIPYGPLPRAAVLILAVLLATGAGALLALLLT